MHKQLSKKSHKQTQSSVDDFMKHIRKYNLQSQRYISPKPLLYMYTNPSRNFTLHTLEKSRSKSKTLSNRKQLHSNSKKSSSKTIRKKVQQLLSSSSNIISKENIHHKKSLSSISNVNKYGEKSAKKLNRSTAEVDLARSKAGLKSKLTQFKLKPTMMTVVTTTQSGSKKKGKKSQQQQQKHHYHPQTSTSHRPLIQSSIPSQSSQIYPSQIPNPAQLIESYSNKLFKTQLFLQSTKHKLGSFLCRKFQSILNEIVESLVQNLKRSLNQLQKQVQDRVTKRLKQQYQHKLQQKTQQVRQLQHVCEKMTKKFTQMLHKQFYSNSLVYRLRLKGVDIDKEFGHAVWGVDDLGGLGYRNHERNGQGLQDQQQEGQQLSQQQNSQVQVQKNNNKNMNNRKLHHRHGVNHTTKSPQKQNPLIDIQDSDNNQQSSNKSSHNSSQENNFEFHPHPLSNRKHQQGFNSNNNNRLTKMQFQQEWQQQQQEIVNVQGQLEMQQQQYQQQQQSQQQQQQQDFTIYYNHQLKQINKSL